MSTTIDPTTTEPTVDATTTAPSTEVPETDLPNPPVAKPRRRRLVALALATVAAAGGTAWILAASGGDAGPAPVEIVEDGRYGGPDIYEHSIPAPNGQTYGSADAAEQQTAPETAADGQTYGSADAAEYQTTPEAAVPDGQTYGSADAAEYQTAS